MSTDLEEQLTRTMAQAAEETPLPFAAPVGAVRALQRRRGRRREGFAAAWAVAAVTAAVLTGSQLAAPEPQQMFAADRIPDFAELPPPEKVWPEAVHRLPPALPDGSDYVVAAVLGDGRYLVHTGRSADHNPAPSIFDTRKGTVTRLGGSTVGARLDWSTVLMARMVDGRAVWIVEGAKFDKPATRELWSAPLDGGPATFLTNLADGVGPRFGSASKSVFWSQQHPGRTSSGSIPTSLQSVPVNGGRVVTIKSAQNYEPTYVGPWITSQYIASGVVPKTSGELRNLDTGERLRWKAAPGVENVQCGPTWCTGDGSGDRIVVQSLDGGEKVELPFRGGLTPRLNGRLAVGRVELERGRKGFEGYAGVVWDRTTGRAATYSLGIHQPVELDRLQGSGAHSFDVAPEVLTLPSNDDEVVILDLAAVK